MRRIVLALAAVGSLSACAGTQNFAVENGVPRGSLAVAAIERGDMQRAERLLVSSELDANDPARLINLGYVYLEQGRRDAAIATWQQALSARGHRVVETLSGREARTDQILRAAIARHQTVIASAN